MKICKGTHPKNGFAFSIAVFAVSLVVGLIVVFLFNTVTLETTTASRSIASRITYWKAMSKVRMLEQLIKDYGFDMVSEGGIIGEVIFYPIDECHRRVVSTIYIGEFTRSIQGILENENCRKDDDDHSYDDDHGYDHDDDHGYDHDDDHGYDDDDDDDDGYDNNGEYWVLVTGSLKEI